MKKGLFLLALGLMSWTVAGSALAGPFGRFARPHQQQQRTLPQGNDNHEYENSNGEKEHGEKEQQRDHADKPAPGQQAPAPAGHENAEGRPGPGPAGQPQPQGQPFGARGGARMSVEERQKLRRQINDAGRSLYTPNTGNK
jgi:hypothetical protein